MAMFAKYLASSLRVQRQPLATAAAVLSPPFPRIILLKLYWLSISIARNDKPTGYPEAEHTCPISKFLLNECGFCQSQLSSVLKKRPSLVAVRSTRTAKRMVQFLRDSGLTEYQVRKTITLTPVLLELNADRQLKPRIEFIETFGFTAQDFGKVIPISSRWLTCSLEKTMRPNIQYLQNLFGSEANISKAEGVAQLTALCI